MEKTKRREEEMITVDAVKKEEDTALSVVKGMCGVSDNPTLARSLPLASSGILAKRCVGKGIMHYFIEGDLSGGPPPLNTIRRKVGWW